MEFTATHEFDRPLDEVSAMFLDPDAHGYVYHRSGSQTTPR